MLANQSALEFHLHGLALVGNLLLRSLGMLRRDETEGQLALANHLWVVTLLCPDRERTATILILEGDASEGPLLISIGYAIVFIQGEVTIGSGIDRKGQVFLYLLSGLVSG